MTISTKTFADNTPSVQWAALLALSLALSVLLTWLALPAALLLGPMIAAIAIGSCGGTLRISSPVFAIAQGLIGCLIAKILPTSISGDMSRQWPLFTAGVLSVIVVSVFLEWVMTRMRVLPGTTLVWGLNPGAATVMTLMAENYGADAQLVAFMQYLRVILVAAIASSVARWWGAGALHSVHTVTWFSSIHWIPFSETIALAVLGPLVAERLKIRAGAFLLPMVVGVILVHLGWMEIELPRWLLAMSYAFFGWKIGLRFTRPLLIHAAKAFPRILLCTLMLIALCGGIAWLLVELAGIDPLTAYLATSPGGADSVAIIAASTKVDIPFVMSMQTARFVTVLILGPILARFVARRIKNLPVIEKPQNPTLTQP